MEDAVEMTPSTASQLRYTRFASTLCYVEGAFLILSAVALGVGAFAQGYSAYAFGTLFGMVCLATLFLAAGWWLRKLRRAGGVLAAVITAARVVFWLVATHTLLNVWLADAAILLLVIAGWGALVVRPPAPADTTDMPS
jgi:hypothetical protein